MKRDSGFHQYAMAASKCGTDLRVAQLTGTPAWVQDTKFGQSVVTFSSSVKASVASSRALILGQRQTVMVWLKPSKDVRDSARLVGKGDRRNRNYGVWRSRNGKLLCQIYGTRGSANVMHHRARAELNEWTHVACVNDGRKMRMYVNGVEVASRHSHRIGVPRMSADPLTIGAAAIHTTFEGQLRDVRGEI